MIKVYLLNKEFFGRVNKIGIHCLLDPDNDSSIDQITDHLNVADRDGFTTIYLYDNKRTVNDIERLLQSAYALDTWIEGNAVTLEFKLFA